MEVNSSSSSQDLDLGLGAAGIKSNNHGWAHYILNPSSSTLTTAQKVGYWFQTIFLGVLSLGTVQLGCLIHEKIHASKGCSTTQKAAGVGQQQLAAGGYEPVQPFKSYQQQQLAAGGYEPVQSFKSYQQQQLAAGGYEPVQPFKSYQPVGNLFVEEQAMPAQSQKTPRKKRLDPETEAVLVRKDYIFAQADEAFEKYEANGGNRDLSVEQLGHPGKFVLGFRDEGQILPSYFDKRLPMRSKHELQLTTTPDFYDYKETGDGKFDVWVDFANRFLGGGALGRGFVQEEIMAAEMPNFRHLLEKHGSNRLLTRMNVDGTSPHRGDKAESPGQGYPTPVLLKGAVRTLAINSRVAYGDKKLLGLQKKQLAEAVTVLKEPQVVNVVAIAAPRLRDKKVQFAKETVYDLFNTIMAGFQLAKEQTPVGQKTVVHSGQLGCGVFNNNSRLVYMLHCLAAQYTGCEVKLHGYSDAQAADFHKSWERYCGLHTNYSLKTYLDDFAEATDSAWQREKTLSSDWDELYGDR